MCICCPLPYAYVAQYNTIQVAVHTELLRLFTKSAPLAAGAGGQDPIVVHTAFTLAKSVHDAIDATTSLETRRDSSALLVSFLARVDFGQDFEQHLNFLVDCRRFLATLDDVTRALTMAVLQLAATTTRKVKLQHTRRTMAFVKACLAYAHVSIAAVQDKVWQLNTMVLAAQQALALGLLSHTDSFLKGAINLIVDIPALPNPPTDAALVSSIASLTSLLILVPGHPEHGPFYLVQGLLNAIKEYPWASDSSQLTCYANVIVLLCAQAQHKMPVGIAMDSVVEANDVLFARDEEFLAQLHVILASLAGQGLEVLRRSKDAGVALKLLNTFLATAQLSPAAAGHVWEMFAIAKRHASSAADRAHLSNTIRYCRQLGANESIKGARLYQELANKMLAR